MNPVTTWVKELSHCWPVLAPSGLEVASAPLPLMTANGQCRVAVDGAGARHLLIPLGPSERPSLGDEEGAVTVRVRTHSFGTGPTRYVDISCFRLDLFDLFDDVLTDVLVAIEAAMESPAETAIAVVNRWRSLLQIRSRRVLTYVGQLALFGELFVLKMTEERNRVRISSWRGPLREPHDIVLDDRAVEVKTVGLASTSIEIHGVRQLEPPGVPLALVVVSVEEDPDGRTLPELVTSLLDTVDDRSEAIRRLGAVGYTVRDSEHYKQRFSVPTVEHVEVSDNTPRIVPSTFAAGGVPGGVDRLVYSVELSSLRSWLTAGEPALRDWLGTEKS
ncbi:PD-(D/E)XK motif protein [Rhodococcus pseudokoreensis]|uniref:PD-(D/E)XK motif protein n=1 Tax=Rhodococcus pseudokoreensis TaxID=2811421 RepID=A0A974WA81_9NOCA|nr:PD-(D/E)XK motif protein [Rhodococcus pseudokoreensis]QSE93904.1 PD-(D/E)XK motif protein [Rhodococcus pseudokoreensis]